jgi:hypothetical protein
MSTEPPSRAEKSRAWRAAHPDEARAITNRASAKFRADPERGDRSRAHVRARSKALTQLARAHPEEYQRLREAALAIELRRGETDG